MKHNFSPTPYKYVVNPTIVKSKSKTCAKPAFKTEICADSRKPRKPEPLRAKVRRKLRICAK